MYVRWTLPTRDRDSEQWTGLLAAAYDLLRYECMPEREEERLREMLKWFEQRLPFPNRRKLKPRAIFWLRAEHREIGLRMADLARFWARRGRVPSLHVTSRPGYVLYEDWAQVAAIPFRDTYEIASPDLRLAVTNWVLYGLPYQQERKDA